MAGELKKSVFTKEHGVGALIAAVAACIPIVGGMFALDARYMKSVDANTVHQALTTQAGDKHYHQDKTREEGDLRTQLALINLEIEFLSNKTDRSATDENRLELLKQQRGIILERLGELKQA